MRNSLDLTRYFEEVEIIEDHWTDIDGSQYVDRSKEIELSESLTLVIYDDGSATLVPKNDDGLDYMIYWDDEAAAMFDRFDELRAVELFEMIYRKRWRSVCE